MTGIFDYIPIITVILFGIGLVGVMVYERARTRQNQEPEPTS
jgi:NADH:ubiquinone oxidoreductase subunit K